MDLSQPVTKAFAQSLPKVELHAHLSGSISRQCLHELWARKKALDSDFPVEDPLVIMPMGKVDYSLQTFFQTFNKSIYQLCTTREDIVHATNSVLVDFLRDGVRYLELRTTPRASTCVSASGRDAFSKEKYILTILDTIDSFRSKTQNEMPVYLILSIDRGNNTASEAIDTVDLVIKYMSRGIVGIDIAGNPLKGDISIYGAAFEKAKTIAPGLGITVHFGETKSSGSKTELDTLLSYSPNRLGHVIYVPDEVKTEVERRGLALELCMSCNVHAGMIEGCCGFGDHHFGQWWLGKGPVVLCTDDVSFFCSPVSNEYRIAAEHFGLSRGDVLGLCRRSVDAIFGGDEERERLRGLLDEFEASELVGS